MGRGEIVQATRIAPIPGGAGHNRS